MKKMFTLRGVSNTGKTTKVKQIAEWIIDNYPVTNPHTIDTTKGEIVGVLEVNKLRIGFNSSGDDLAQVKKVEKLLANNKSEDQNKDDIDIIINTCRTRGAGRKYLENNFNKKKGWVLTNIYIQKFKTSEMAEQSLRDSLIFDELKSWLTGLEKL